VTEAVIRKIARSAIFGEDSGDFTRRTAWVESFFGDDVKTYRPGYHGGIWQADQRIYNLTRDTATYPNLVQLHSSIYTHFGINWTATTWDDLETPLHSALAFRQFFLGVMRISPLPGLMRDQGDIWIRHYNRNDSMSQLHFINMSRELESEPICKGKMDACIVLDGSSSVSEANFEKSLSFVHNLIESFEIGAENVRAGFVQYSSDNETIFPVENGHQKDELLKLINDTTQLGERTDTPEGILQAVELLTKNLTNVRSGVPSTMIILTDGKSNEGNLPAAIEQARRAEIYSFAVGIGSGAEYRELLQIAYNDSTHVFQMEDFDALVEFFYRLNSQTCTTPQTPEPEDEVVDTLGQGEKRYYLYTLPSNGITLKLVHKSGRTNLYYSYTDETPSSALYDGVMTSGGNELFIPPIKSSGIVTQNGQSRFLHAADVNATVFISIEGVNSENEYTMKTLQGDQTSAPSSSSFGAVESFSVIFVSLIAVVGILF
jgi:hypothetical protein